MGLRDVTHDLRAGFLLKHVKRFGLLSSTDSVIDIGAGNGRLSLAFQKEFGCNITVADVVNVLPKSSPLAFLRVVNECNIPVNDKLFDVALLIDMVHHVPYAKQELLLNEAERVAQRVIIIDTLPSIAAIGIDCVNKMQGMITPFAFRSWSKWNILAKERGYVLSEIKCKWWYPLRHVILVK